VISVTAFMWMIVVFLASVSRALVALLHSISAVSQGDTPPAVDSQFRARGCVRAAYRCIRSTIGIRSCQPRLLSTQTKMRDRDWNSGLYGSIVHRWTQSKSHEFRRTHYCSSRGRSKAGSFQRLHQLSGATALVAALIIILVEKAALRFSCPQPFSTLLEDMYSTRSSSVRPDSCNCLTASRGDRCHELWSSEIPR